MVCVRTFLYIAHPVCNGCGGVGCAIMNSQLNFH